MSCSLMIRTLRSREASCTGCCMTLTRHARAWPRARSPAEATAGANGFGQPGYLGPAPPPGDDPHHYVFRLLAVDEPVSLTGLPSYQDVETAVTGHILGEARLIGTYQR